eukprot:9324930-Karenia_brevis.AAC.1
MDAMRDVATDHGPEDSTPWQTPKRGVRRALFGGSDSSARVIPRAVRKFTRVRGRLVGKTAKSDPRVS